VHLGLVSVFGGDVGDGAVAAALADVR